MLVRIALAILVLASGLAGFIATRPDTFHVERSAQVNAPPDAVFALINDFHQWAQWSPYEKLDPAMKKKFEGPEAGPGAVYAWSGEKAGAGRMTLLEGRPAERVVIRLEFLEPFQATNEARFTLAPSGTGTRVTWSMDGQNNLVSKAASLFMDMDALIGKDFAQGLASLDAAAQASQGRTAAAQQDL
jgi:carbon monoxide dehydrogenase subunit G